jgi:Fur family iron response transcriptional regulator
MTLASLTRQRDQIAGGPSLGLAPAADPESRLSHRCRELLRDSGLRPTRQRMMLGWMLFSGGNRHVTAEMLYEQALEAKFSVSLATIYNTLHQFTRAGLLRQIGVDGTRSFFDTNPIAHHHFFVEDDEALFDVPEAELVLGNLPQAPDGFEIVRVEVVVRLRRKKASSS